MHPAKRQKLSPSATCPSSDGVPDRTALCIGVQGDAEDVLEDGFLLECAARVGTLCGHPTQAQETEVGFPHKRLLQLLPAERYSERPERQTGDVLMDLVRAAEAAGKRRHGGRASVWFTQETVAKQGVGKDGPVRHMRKRELERVDFGILSTPKYFEVPCDAEAHPVLEVPSIEVKWGRGQVEITGCAPAAADEADLLMDLGLDVVKNEQKVVVNFKDVKVCVISSAGGAEGDDGKIMAVLVLRRPPTFFSVRTEFNPFTGETHVTETRNDFAPHRAAVGVLQSIGLVFASQHYDALHALITNLEANRVRPYFGAVSVVPTLILGHAPTTTWETAWITHSFAAAQPWLGHYMSGVARSGEAVAHVAVLQESTAAAVEAARRALGLDAMRPEGPPEYFEKYFQLAAVFEKMCREVLFANGGEELCVFPAAVLHGAAPPGDRLLNIASSAREDAESACTRIPPDCVHVFGVEVTPTGLRCRPPQMMRANSVLRHFCEAAWFLRVRFCDEDGAEVPEGPLCEAMVRRAFDGTHSFGTDRRYRWLHWSNSQHRSQALWFMAPRPGAGIDVQTVREWVGRPPAAGTPTHGELVTFSVPTLAELWGKGACKVASRLALAFSSTVPLAGHPMVCRMVADVERNGYCFTDGSGFVSTRVQKLLAEALGFKANAVPSAFQIRCGGAKGVVLMKPSMAQHVDLELRPSQVKFQSARIGALEVIGAAQRHPCYLNRQIIVLLVARGVPHAHILDMLCESLDAAALEVTGGPEAARAALGRMGMWPGGDGSGGDAAVDAAYLMEEPFHRVLLQYAFLLKVGRLARKTHVFVEKGALLMGVPDPSGLLAEGEVYVQLSSTPPGCAATVLTGPCVVAKNPCLHPGDIVAARAVPCAALSHVVDCVVFSVQGSRPMADQTAGSDLDGDMFFVAWDERLLPAEPCAPMAFDEDAAAPVSPRSPPSDPDAPLAEYFLECQGTALGRICTAHVVWADMEGAGSAKCQTLAKLAAAAVDAPKTGRRVELPQELAPKSYPAFMEKWDREEHRTPGSVVQQCHDVCPKMALQDVFFLLDAAAADGGENADAFLEGFVDPAFLVDGHEAYAEAAAAAFRDYQRQLGQLASSLGLVHEAELFAGTVDFHRGYSRRDREASAAVVERVMAGHRAQYRRAFFAAEGSKGSLPPAEVEKKASAWYFAAYEAQRQRLQGTGGTKVRGAQKNLSFLSFAWIVGDVLLRIRARRTTAPVGRWVYERLGESLGTEWAAASAAAREALLNPPEEDSAVRWVLEGCVQGEALLPVVYVLRRWAGDVLCLPRAELNLVFALFGLYLSDVRGRPADVACVLVSFLQFLAARLRPGGNGRLSREVEAAIEHAAAGRDVRRSLPDVFGFRGGLIAGAVRRAVVALLATRSAAAMLPAPDGLNSSAAPLAVAAQRCVHRVLVPVPEAECDWIATFLEGFSTASDGTPVVTRCEVQARGGGGTRQLVAVARAASATGAREFSERFAIIRKKLREWHAAASPGNLLKGNVEAALSGVAFSVDSFPIGRFKDDICAAVRAHPVVVIRAPTGSGKSLAVPKLLLDDHHASGLGAMLAPRRILCTQPRRVAATRLAARVAELSGSAVGGAVGYQIGGAGEHGRETNLLYCTTGIGLHYFMRDAVPWSVLIIDEVHCRTMLDDVLMAVVKHHHLRQNPNLKVVLMSAAADCGQLSRYFDDCPVIDLEKRCAPPHYVAEHYLDTDPWLRGRSFTKHKLAAGSEDIMASLLAVIDTMSGKQRALFPLDETARFVLHLNDVHRARPDRKFLVFVAGVADLNALCWYLDDEYDDASAVELDVRVLHSRLSIEQQQRVLADDDDSGESGKPRRVVILATDVVESCVTIPECHVVVDTCVHKRRRRGGASVSADGTALTLEYISRDEALQRRGRTGRTCDGTVYRLLTEQDFERLGEHAVVEMLSANVAEVLLQVQEALPKLGSTGLGTVAEFLGRCVPSPPPQEAVDAAYQKLKEVGAIVEGRAPRTRAAIAPASSPGASGELTYLGKLMQRLPQDPDVVHLVFNGLRYGVLPHAEVCAAILLRGSPFFNDTALVPWEKVEMERVRLACCPSRTSDVLAKLGAFLAWQRANEVRWAGGVAHTEADLREEQAWCFHHYLSLEKLREIDETVLQIRREVAEVGLAAPHAKERGTVAAARARLARRFGDAPLGGAWQPAGKAAQDIAMLLSDRGVTAREDKLLRWCIMASFPQNVAGVLGHMHAQPQLKYTSRRSNERFSKRGRRRQKKYYEHINYQCDVRSQGFLSYFLRDLGFAVDSIHTSDARDTSRHTVTFNTHADAALAAQLRPSNEWYPYTRIEVAAEVLHKRAFLGEAPVVLTTDTVCDLSGQNCVAGATVIPSANMDNRVSHVFLDLTALPSAGIHHAVYAATSPLFPRCMYGGVEEDMCAVQFSPAVDAAIKVIQEGFDAEFAWVERGGYLDRASGALCGPAADAVCARQDAVVALFGEYERDAAAAARALRLEAASNVKKRWRVPNGTKGKLIGTGGATVKALSKRCNVRIDARGDPSLPVTCVGPADGVAAARREVVRICRMVESEDEG